MNTLRELWDMVMKTIWVGLFIALAIWGLKAMGEADQCMHGHTPDCEHKGVWP